jgi:hypothetical protein
MKNVLQREQEGSLPLALAQRWSEVNGRDVLLQAHQARQQYILTFVIGALLLIVMLAAGSWFGYAPSWFLWTAVVIVVWGILSVSCMVRSSPHRFGVALNFFQTLDLLSKDRVRWSISQYEKLAEERLTVAGRRVARYSEIASSELVEVREELMDLYDLFLELGLIKNVGYDYYIPDRYTDS